MKRSAKLLLTLLAVALLAAAMTVVSLANVDVDYIWWNMRGGYIADSAAWSTHCNNTAFEAGKWSVAYTDKADNKFKIGSVFNSDVVYATLTETNDKTNIKAIYALENNEKFQNGDYAYAALKIDSSITFARPAGECVGIILYTDADKEYVSTANYTGASVNGTYVIALPAIPSGETVVRVGVCPCYNDTDTATLADYIRFYYFGLFKTEKDALTTSCDRGSLTYNLKAPNVWEINLPGDNGYYFGGYNAKVADMSLIAAGETKVEVTDPGYYQVCSTAVAGLRTMTTKWECFIYGDFSGHTVMNYQDFKTHTLKFDMSENGISGYWTSPLTIPNLGGGNLTIGVANVSLVNNLNKVYFEYVMPIHEQFDIADYVNLQLNFQTQGYFGSYYDTAADKSTIKDVEAAVAIYVVGRDTPYIIEDLYWSKGNYGNIYSIKLRHVYSDINGIVYKVRFYPFYDAHGAKAYDGSASLANPTWDPATEQYVVLNSFVLSPTTKAPAPTGLRAHAAINGNVGYISGLDSNTTYQWRASGSTDWNTITGVAAIYGLVPGNYDVQYPLDPHDKTYDGATYCTLTVYATPIDAPYSGLDNLMKTSYSTNDLVVGANGFSFDVSVTRWIGALALKNILASTSNVDITFAGKGYVLTVNTANLTSISNHYYDFGVTFDGASPYDRNYAKIAALAGNKLIKGVHFESTWALPFSTGILKMFVGADKAGKLVEIDKYDAAANTLTQVYVARVDADGYATFKGVINGDWAVMTTSATSTTDPEEGGNTNPNSGDDDETPAESFKIVADYYTAAISGEVAGWSTGDTGISYDSSEYDGAIAYDAKGLVFGVSKKWVGYTVTNTLAKDQQFDLTDYAYIYLWLGQTNFTPDSDDSFNIVFVTSAGEEIEFMIPYSGNENGFTIRNVVETADYIEGLQSTKIVKILYKPFENYDLDDTLYAYSILRTIGVFNDYDEMDQYITLQQQEAGAGY